jgi:SAM-dependent methyltransferase
MPIQGSTVCKGCTFWLSLFKRRRGGRFRGCASTSLFLWWFSRKLGSKEGVSFGACGSRGVLSTRSRLPWRFVAEGLARVLDVGCGEGELARYLSDGAWVGLDNSQTKLDLLSYATEVNVEPGLTEDGAAESSTALGWLCRRVGC